MNVVFVTMINLSISCKAENKEDTVNDYILYIETCTRIDTCLDIAIFQLMLQVYKWLVSTGRGNGSFPTRDVISLTVSDVSICKEHACFSKIEIAMPRRTFFTSFLMQFRYEILQNDNPI
jgi:hypothetical protein